jgi:hypothetical protein
LDDAYTVHLNRRGFAGKKFDICHWQGLPFGKMIP